MKIVLSLLVPLLVGLVFNNGDTQAENPGKCPPPEELTLGVCFRVCYNDTDCGEFKKCCQTGCDGYQCLIPVDKPGLCPPFTEPLNRTACVKTTQCKSDTNCDDHLKCCPAACNSTSCQTPV